MAVALMSRQILTDYPYLHANLLLLGVVLLAVRRIRTAAHRRLIVRLGLVMAVFSPFAAVSEGVYWSPRRILGGAFGFEDLLCAFNIGALGVFPVVLVFRRTLALARRPLPSPRRLALLAALTLSLFFALRQLGVNVLSATVLMQLVLSAGLLLARRELWPLCLVNGVAVALVHCLLLKALFWAWPGFVSSWSHTLPWGALVVGIPLGEIVWALSFGVLWALFAGYVFDLRLIPRGASLPPAEEPEMEVTA